MKIALASDIHLEFGDLEFTNEGADILVLAGDIMIAQNLYDHTTESIQNSIDQNSKCILKLTKVIQDYLSASSNKK